MRPRAWVLTGLLLACSTVSADTLRIPLGQQGNGYPMSTPQLGQDMNSVLRTWGEPLKRHAAVGQPPISRWDYLEFSVYFEHSHVISSVRQHHRQQP